MIPEFGGKPFTGALDQYPGRGRYLVPMDREQAGDLIHERLPDRWRVGRPTFDPATHRWEVSAMSPSRGRRKVWTPPDYLFGTRPDELGALEDVAAKLGETSGA